ncbi:MAG: molybdopterin molybdotransferase MoeA [Lentisphaerae bacterium]|nr:molybdopterin molybdotransferase MoeA [Lentisphaerota bacterium]
MMTPLEAWQSIGLHTQPLPATHRSLASATGYVLSEAVVADRDVPPVNRAAMDGYAVRAEDLASCPATLTLIGEVAAGSDATPLVSQGECVAIYTGANVPPGADSVIMVEETEAAGTTIRFLKPPRSGQHIFRQGENAQRGEILLEAGVVLGAAEVGVCAAVGVDRPSVFGRPRVAILSTGAELLDASEEVEAHQLRNSNGPMLVAGLTAAGFEVTHCRAVDDDEERIVQGIRDLLSTCDCLILTGGVSVGKYDLVPQAIQQAGGTVHFHGVAIKPGKPQLFATTDAGKILYGLPGNPLSSMVGLQEFILPALRRMAGTPVERCRPMLKVHLGADIGGKTGRLRHNMVSLVSDETWGMVAMPVTHSGSADLIAGARADGTVIIPADVASIPAGKMVHFCPWRTIG